MIMHGAGVPSVEASGKYAGSSGPSNGTQTRVVAGSPRSNDFCIVAR
jgi:hypothetical protein